MEADEALFRSGGDGRTEMYFSVECRQVAATGAFVRFGASVVFAGLWSYVV